MRTQDFLKIGTAAVLSIFLVACKSSGEVEEAPEAAPEPVVSRPATPPAGPSAAELAEQRRRDEMLAMTVFYFDFDKSELKPEAREALVYHANQLKANPSRRIRLEGHADERGTREYNLALGERRAQAVERYLVVQGVSASQIETISYGEERPAATGTTEAAYSRNRRVELK